MVAIRVHTNSLRKRDFSRKVVNGELFWTGCETTRRLVNTSPPRASASGVGVFVGNFGDFSSRVGVSVCNRDSAPRLGAESADFSNAVQFWNAHGAGMLGQQVLSGKCALRACIGRSGRHIAGGL